VSVVPDEPVSPQNVLSSVTDQTTVEWQRAWIQELKQKQRQRLVARRIRQEITVRAREIREQNGRPSGRDEEFWLQAETEITEHSDLVCSECRNLTSRFLTQPANLQPPLPSSSSRVRSNDITSSAKRIASLMASCEAMPVGPAFVGVEFYATAVGLGGWVVRG
jgi:hypothetical protein